MTDERHIAGVDLRVDGDVVRIRQHRGGYSDWLFVGLMLVGVVGVIALLTNPISAATWILGPFIVGFLALGTWAIVVRLTGRDAVVIDLAADTITTLGRTSRLGDEPRVVVVRGTRMSSGMPRAAWHVDLMGDTARIRVADFLGEDDAGDVADEVARLINGS